MKIMMLLPVYNSKRLCWQSQVQKDVQKYKHNIINVSNKINILRLVISFIAVTSHLRMLWGCDTNFQLKTLT